MPSGYNAIKGAPIRGPNLTKAESTDFHLCDKGYFCDKANDATARSKKCPIGKFMPTEGAASASDCLPCNGGHTCGPAEGVVNPVACASGHYCPDSTTTTVVGAGASPVTPKLCTAGHECPSKVHALYKCALGKFSSGTGAVACSTCTAGKFCIVADPGSAVKAPAAAAGGSKASAEIPCTAGYFCKSGYSYPQSCKEGELTASAGASTDADVAGGC